MDILFLIFPLIFILFFAVFLVLFVMTMVKGIKQWNKNNHSPRLTVDAKVVSKQSSTSHHRHHHNNGVGHTTTSTSYYVTFEVESGDRMELQMSRYEYAMIAEGDFGKLSFQGTRYLSFERK